MLKIAICDNNKSSIDQISEYLNYYLSEHKINFKVLTFDSGEKFLQQRNMNFDLLLLEIEIGKLSGIDVKNILQDMQINIRILYITSYSERWQESFGENVCGYIEKPVSYSKLSGYLDRIIKRIKFPKTPQVTLPTFSRIPLSIDNIIYIKAEKKYSYITTSNIDTPFFSDKSIGKWECELDNKVFFRCHNTYLVNICHLVNFDQHAIMANNEIIPISRRKRNAFEEFYELYSHGIGNLTS